MADTLTRCPQCATTAHHLITGHPVWQQTTTTIDVPDLGVPPAQYRQVPGPVVEQHHLPRQCTTCGHEWPQVIDTRPVKRPNTIDWDRLNGFADRIDKVLTGWTTKPDVDQHD